jgi:hypothetical protein
MCVNRIAAIAVLDPGNEQAPASGSSTAHQPVPLTLRVRRFFAFGIGHGFFDLRSCKTSLWVVLLHVLPVGAVPDDRPIVHSA